MRNNRAEAYFDSQGLFHYELSERYAIETDTSDTRLEEIAYRMVDEADAELDIHECLAVAEAVRGSQRDLS